jgi:cell wall-associated NlpC family hydrolase
MRAFPLAWRSVAIAVVLALASTTSAHADKPTVSELQIQLVKQRQQLNDLYAQSAAASERLNGAKYELATAKKVVARHRAQVAAARKKLEAQQSVVAAMTVEQLQAGSSAAKLTAMFSSDGPEQLLDRSSAYASTNEALAARVASFKARKVVLDSAAHQAEDALEAQKKATTNLKAAKDAIKEAIARAEQMAANAEKARHDLLVQLAEATGTSVEEVTRHQDAIDQQIDESGPGTPPAPGPAPTPTPTPTPTTSPPPPVNPPPPSTSKVETAIAFAKAQLGEPYEWGAAGPDSWDCSGLTMRAWQAAGIYLPHYAGAQYANTKPVPISKIVRGDLLYWSNGGPSSIYHEALYLGGGLMIHAPRPGRNVEIVSVSYWIKPDLASRPAS